ncbi:MAG: alcohol dehydrogenase [Fimbriimonadales bacterium]|nr:MAG: alcohol dehydrogenase [Fimbriimonadales bacterium]GIV09497.1 MAG: alcohol dehydrogenase [Fimbriimonadales bacterium]GIV11681.1 MAG: alcohol dehydrogenase [Fimbriimonadales bacterium]
MLRTIFGFEMPTRLLFGQGAVENLGFECSLNGWASALIVTDEGVHRSGLTQPVEAQLQTQGVRYEVYAGVVPNPTIESIEAAVPQAQDKDAVIAVGGGSVMDSAKLINALRSHGGRVRDYEGTDTVPAPCQPLIAIPTTAGTGSEVTFIAMFTDTQKRQKMPVLSRYLAPHLAIVDPEMTRNLPPAATAQTGLDALTHAIEAVVDVQANPFSDMLAFEAIRLITRYLPRAVQNGAADIEARGAMAFAATIAGAAFNNSMVGLAHAMAHAIGGLYNLPHGLCCALALPVAMHFNLESQRVRFEQIAQVMGYAHADTEVVPLPHATLQGGMWDKTFTAEDAILRVRQLMSEVGVPAHLLDVGVQVSEADLETLTDLTFVDGSILFNPVQPTREQMKQLLSHISTYTE